MLRRFGSACMLAQLVAAAALAVSVGFVAPANVKAQGWSGSNDDWASPESLWTCPVTQPIKGNAQSGIYHVPGGQYYGRTQPEDCFATEAAARAYGYRRSLR